MIFIELIIFLVVFFCASWKANNSKDFNGILWGILTGATGGLLFSLIACFVIRNSKYLTGVIIGVIINFIITLLIA